MDIYSIASLVGMIIGCVILGFSIGIIFERKLGSQEHDLCINMLNSKLETFASDVRTTLWCTNDKIKRLESEIAYTQECLLEDEDDDIEEITLDLPAVKEDPEYV